MADALTTPSNARHSHIFLGAGHEASERRTWAVIWLCGAMMVAEIIGGAVFGSIALVADGLHMSTHAGALLLAAMAYSYARRHADDPRFSFGAGKLGDLAGFTSAIVLAMIALLIAYEAVARLLHPVAIQFGEAIPIATLGLCVNIASAWILSSGGHHHHGHAHGHQHDHGGHDHGDHDHGEETQTILTAAGPARLSVFETGVPPRFRIQWQGGPGPAAESVSLETERAGGGRQLFAFSDRGRFLESAEEIPEPHAFTARLRIAGEAEQALVFEEHDHGHGSTHRDNNMRAAVVHVMADAVVSLLVIAGLLLARLFGWLWMDPVAGIVGAAVIASWSYGLIRDTGSILLDMTPDRRLADTVRRTVEAEGDELTDLHLWRLGPGHLGAIVSICAKEGRGTDHYRARFANLPTVSHLTVEVTHPHPVSAA